MGAFKVAFKVIGHQRLIILCLFDYFESSNIIQISEKHIRFHLATSKLFCADFFARIEQSVALLFITKFLAKAIRKSETMILHILGLVKPTVRNFD